MGGGLNGDGLACGSHGGGRPGLQMFWIQIDRIWGG